MIMERQNLLIDCNIKAIKERLQTTLANIQFQKGVMYWDDEEKLEHCIAALEILEEDKKKIVKCWKCNAENEEKENYIFCNNCLTHL